MSTLVGQLVLVDTSEYGVPGRHWCEVLHIAPGSAATYPVKVQIPGRGEGQYKHSEVQGKRRSKGEPMPASCPDCGAAGERAGHMGCQYPRDHE